MQALLREHAELDIDGPGVLLREHLDCIEALEADARIDLDVRAHELGAGDDRLRQRAPGTRGRCPPP